MSVNHFPVDVWTLALGDYVRVYGSPGCPTGLVFAIQRRRNRVLVQWPDGSQGWYSAKRLQLSS